jgi:GntR family transcriptional repressor for pyruvate dehydrogenase complex
MSSTINRVPSTQTVEELIKQAILNGHFPRGSQLPPERSLVERFGVSRTAIREAMKSLHAQGIVSVRHGYGTFVSEDSGHFLALSMSTLLAMGDISLSETMGVREVLEPSLSAYAAEHRSDEQADELMEIVSRMTQTVGDPYRYEELDAAFHFAIARVTRNRLISQILQSVRELLRTQIHDLLEDPAWQSATLRDEQHRLIAEAIRHRDKEGARTAMRRHLELSTVLMVARLRRDSDEE